MPNAQGPGLCSTLVDKKDDHVYSMLVHVVCCNLIRVFFYKVIPTLLGSDFGVLGLMSRCNDAITSWLKLTATSNNFP